MQREGRMGSGLLGTDLHHSPGAWADLGESCANVARHLVHTLSRGQPQAHHAPLSLHEDLGKHRHQANCPVPPPTPPSLTADLDPVLTWFWARVLKARISSTLKELST